MVLSGAGAGHLFSGKRAWNRVNQSESGILSVCQSFCQSVGRSVRQEERKNLYERSKQIEMLALSHSLIGLGLIYTQV